MVNLLFKMAGVFLGGYVLIVAAMYFFQEKMLFFPSGPSFGSCPGMERYRAKAVKSGGIRYYWKKSVPSKRIFIVFHGNAGGACDRTYFFDLLSGLDGDIALFEYPGYGMDHHKPGEKIICEKALEAVEHIKVVSGHSRPVFLVGESLGTGVATWVSTRTTVSGLILISAYTAISDVAANHYPWLPVRGLLKHRFPAAVWASQTQSAAVLFHGVKDDIIPVRFARQQEKQFKSGAKLFEIENCGHNDIIDTGNTLIRNRVKAFVSDHSGFAVSDQG